jgi:hypothetical protein
MLALSCMDLEIAVLAINVETVYKGMINSVGPVEQDFVDCPAVRCIHRYIPRVSCTASPAPHECSLRNSNGRAS